METTPLNPNLPGVRILQTWIREGLAVSMAVLDQEGIEGRLIWQDSEFLALERLGSTSPVLIARRHITLIRSID
jgi:host factor-I protein